MAVNSAAIGRVIAHGASDSEALEQAQAGGPTAARTAMLRGGPPGGSSTGGGAQGTGSSAAQSAAGAPGGQAGGESSEGQGVLAKAGAALGAVVSAEQSLSTLLSGIPMPAFPAARITDWAFGIPHAHSHPPNLIPPAPPIPLPATGPIIKIPYVSGADRVLINNLPAARCGDMGVNIWCGGYFPFYEIFLGSSNVWIEGARAARLGVDMTKHCIFSTPKPNDVPLGPMIGAIVQGSPNVIIGGVPLPSLTNFAIGLAFKALFKGVGKIVKAARAAKAGARAALMGDEIVPMFSKGEHVSVKPRPEALDDVLKEIKAAGVEVRADREAEEYLNYCARQHGIDPSQMHAVTLGDDLIMIRPEHANDPRILREELIHTEQAKAGLISSTSVVENEIAAREKMIANAEQWGITPDEVTQMQKEIDIMRATGKY
jgi:uncharacterized Zn-binding protein involved in type VI secretion